MSRGSMEGLDVRARKGLTEKVTHGQRLEGSEEVSYTDIWWWGEHSKEQITSAKAVTGSKNSAPNFSMGG